MKVILLENVAQLGQKYDVCDVPHGHALNFLFPKKLAEPATKKGLKRIEKMQAERASLEAQSLEQFEKAAETLSTEPLTVAAPANESGHLYESVKNSDLATESERRGLSIPPEQFVLEDPIKAIGEHKVALVLGDRKETVTVNVVSKT